MKIISEHIKKEFDFDTCLEEYQKKTFYKIEKMTDREHCGMYKLFGGVLDGKPQVAIFCKSELEVFLLSFHLYWNGV